MGCGFLFVFGIIFYFVFDYGSGGFIPFLAWPIGIVLYCIIASKQRKISQQWQLEMVTALNQKMQMWKTQYPMFTFSILWPVNEYRRNRRSNSRLIAVWCMVRITQGPCTTTYETIYATTGNAQSAAAQPIQVVPAMVNGQQVILVQQQAPIQQPVVQQQQPQYNQVQQQQQPSAPPTYNADIYAPPPAYDDVGADGPGNVNVTNQ